MATHQDEQQAVEWAVCEAMIACTPDDWEVIVLTLERPDGATELGQLRHSISSPHSRHPVTPNDALYEATYRLDELLRRHGSMFRRALYRVELHPESWVYMARFDYDEVEPGRAAAV
jgi:hypothetical protein